MARRFDISSLRVGLMCSALLSGCALTPDYERPVLDVPVAYHVDSEQSSTIEQGESIANLAWWQVFEDAQLQGLIRSALAENKDIGVALSRVAQASYQLTSTRANQYPFIDITAGAARSRQSEFLMPGASIEESFSVMGNLSFELDLWRKLSRSTESARRKCQGLFISQRSCATPCRAEHRCQCGECLYATARPG